MKQILFDVLTGFEIGLGVFIFISVEKYCKRLKQKKDAAKEREMYERYLSENQYSQVSEMIEMKLEKYKAKKRKK